MDCWPNLKQKEQLGALVHREMQGGIQSVQTCSNSALWSLSIASTHILLFPIVVTKLIFKVLGVVTTREM